MCCFCLAILLVENVRIGSLQIQHLLTLGYDVQRANFVRLDQRTAKTLVSAQQAQLLILMKAHGINTHIYMGHTALFDTSEHKFNPFLRDQTLEYVK